MAELKAVVTFTDYKRLITVMRQVEPDMVKALRKRYRQIGAPLVKDIRNGIPASAPLSGMVTKVGRLSWSRTINQNKPVRSVVVRDRKRSPRSKYLIVGLVQAVVGAAPVALVDMAGRSGAYINSRDMTREYDYTYQTSGGPVLGKRKHRIRGQGRAMIARLGGRGSRYVYPAAEKALPQARTEMQAAVNDAVNEINAKLRRR